MLRVAYGDFQAILAADATEDTEQYILDTQGSLESEVLKVGHHGSSSTSTTERWARAVSPELAVASAGRCNSNGHPSRTVVDRLAKYTAEDMRSHRISVGLPTGGNCQKRFEKRHSYEENIFSTADSGHIVLVSDGSKYWLEQ